MSLSPEDVQDIVRLVDSTDYDEIELATDRFVLRLRRGPGGWTGEQHTAGPARQVGGDAGTGPADTETAGTGTAGDPATGPPAGGGGPDGDDRPDLVAVRAPLPGVFYRAPKPGAAPFVEVGQRVGPDDVVAILETMKLMNPVRAGAAGTVAEFAVANNEPAEQAAVLLWLRPDDDGGGDDGDGGDGGDSSGGGESDRGSHGGTGAGQ